MLGKLLSRVKPFKRMDNSGAFNNIHPIEEFHKVILRERERSDRTGLPVSLFVFCENNKSLQNGSLKDLVDLLHMRVRLTDEIGWYDEARVGLILPHTDVKNAMKFSKYLQELLTRRTLSYDYELFIYPAPLSNNFHMVSGPLRVSNQVSEEDDRQTPIENSIAGIHHPFTRYPLWKRLFDFTGALAGLIFLSPLLFMIATFIKLVSPGPCLFRQVRIGFLGHPFTILKFRTMHCDSESSSHEQYLEDLIHSGGKRMIKLDESDDPRIFAFGKLLRKTCLDELPQLVNVLRGEMSIVGPRPCLPYEAEKYHLWHTKRFDAMPGLTGLWQVSGKNKTTFNEMIRLDIEYGRRKSFWLDVKIIVRTIPALILETATAS